MSLRLNGRASLTSSGSSSEVNVLPPLARALPSLLTAIRLTEQEERRATATGRHVTHSRTIRGFISISIHVAHVRESDFRPGHQSLEAVPVCFVQSGLSRSRPRHDHPG